MARAFDYRILDVFTDRVFGGNPLAVFPDARGLDDATMQAIAREMNLSETVFLSAATTPDGTRRVRIFTPARELPFAGHPTLGAAWDIVAHGARDGGGAPGRGDASGAPGGAVTVLLDEGVGRVPVEVSLEDGAPRFARLTAAVAPTARPVALSRDEMAGLLTLEPDALGSDELGPEVASAGLPFTVIPVRDLDALGRARVDSATWDRLLRGDEAEMIYVVARDGREVDFRVRMFCPGLGFPEDPATGSAAAAFAGYLGRRVEADGEHAWRLDQGIEIGRPSRLDIDARVEGGVVKRVRVGGQAVYVSRGTMELPA